MSPPGTKPTSNYVCDSVANGGKAEVLCSVRAFPVVLMASHQLDLPDYADDPTVQRRVGLMLARFAEQDQERLNS